MQANYLGSVETVTGARLEDQQATRFYLWAMLGTALFQVAHVLSLPVVISFDGYGYLHLAEIIGTPRFAAEWDYLRTPLFPLLMKAAFLAFGKSATTFLTLQALMAFTGIWAIATTLRRACHPWVAAACFPLLAFSPVLVGFEHSMLTEVGTFLVVSLIFAALMWPANRLWLKTAVLVVALILGYYQRLSVVYLAPVAAAFYAFWLAQVGLPRAILRRVIASHVTMVLVIPFLATYPWQRELAKTSRLNDAVILYGLVKQAAIPEDSLIWGSAAPLYKKAVAESTDHGFFAIGGLRNATEYTLIGYLASRGVDGGTLYRHIVLTRPSRFAFAVVRTLASYAGLSGTGSENALFRNLTISSGSAPVLLPGPEPQRSAASVAFIQHSTNLRLGKFLALLAPLYELMSVVSAFAAVFLFVVGWQTRRVLLITLSGVPLSFCAIHSLTLNSLDRMAAPIQPLLLAAGILATAYVLDRPADQVPPHIRWQIRPAYLLIGVVAAIGICHVVYLSASKQIPSADEAHFMSGVLSIAGALRSGSPPIVWAAYTTALGFKAPLICVPAALLAAITGGCVGPSMASLILIWVATLISAYFLFRLILPFTETTLATLLLATMPMVTGLTHRFYVEGLLLLLVIVFLLGLVRWELESYRGAIILGLVFGLGILCQTTFAFFAGIPLAYVALTTIAEGPRHWRDWQITLRISGRLCVLLAVAFLVAWTWYGRNWRSAAAYVTTFYSCATCNYPTVAAFLANVTAGPNIVTFIMATLAFPPLVRILMRGCLDRKKRLTWSVLLLSATATLLLVTVSMNKATRLSVTWLPAIAALAAFMPLVRFRSSGLRVAVIAIAASFSITVFLQNSFAMLPIGPLRLGEVKLLDSRYPLNVPDWFDDNHPVERRDFGLDAMARLIAQDARGEFEGKRASVRLAEFGLLPNHDYLNLSARLHGEPVDYLWWPGATLSGSDAPDYILGCKGCEAVFPGREAKDYYPMLDDDVAAGRVSFDVVGRLQGPSEIRWTVYRKRQAKAISPP